MNCLRCGEPIPESDHGNGLCDDCRSQPAPSLNDDAELDRLIEAASVPNLAQLYKRAKGQGFITPTQSYS